LPGFEGYILCGYRIWRTPAVITMPTSGKSADGSFVRPGRQRKRRRCGEITSPEVMQVGTEKGV
jgi:hypothetical protein